MKRDAKNSSASTKKMVELSQTAVAIDAYVKRLGENFLAGKIPVLDEQKITPDNWDDILSRAKTKADGAAKALQDKMDMVKDGSGVAGNGKKMPVGTRGVKRGATVSDEVAAGIDTQDMRRTNELSYSGL